MKISFDFDDTLSNPRLQLMASVLIKAGHEVWIVTSRMSNERAQNPSWNRDLEVVADCCGIENIHYCNLKPKHEFFKEHDFDIHIDDDHEDVEGINLYTDTNAFLFVDTYTGETIKQVMQYVKKYE